MLHAVRELARLAKENTLIFVGTSLQDNDLRQLLLWIDSQEAQRPRGFLITRSAPEVAKRFWDSKRITVLPGTFEEFLHTLDHQLKGIVRSISRVTPVLPVHSKLTVDPTTLRDETNLALELDYDFIHAGMSTTRAEPILFYKGFSQSWGAIEQNLDTPRLLSDVILSEAVLDAPSDGSQFYIIKAPAGSGKTVLLRRVAWESSQQMGKFCLFLKDGRKLDPEVLLEIASSTDLRLFLFVDDVGDFLTELATLLRQAEKRKLSITVISAERTNEWNVAAVSSDLTVTREFTLKPLTKPEIGKLLYLLEQNKALGSLASKTPEEREHQLYELAQGHLLVALHEALLGKKFEDIVVDEFNKITPMDAQSLYLTICLLNRTGAPVRAGLISRLHNLSFADFERKLFAPLEHVVYARMGPRGYDYEYTARHQYVAELVVRHVLQNPEKLLDKLLRIFDSMNLSYDADQRAFRELISHRTLSGLLIHSGLIKSAYDRAAELFPDNGHVHLHRGLFEMWHRPPDIETASESLQRASELLPKSRIVQHALAQLERSKALNATSVSAREAHRKRALTLLSDLRLDSSSRGEANAYAEVTVVGVELDRLRDLMATPGTSEETIQDQIAKADEAIDRGLQRCPGEPHLLRAEAELSELLNDQTAAIASLEKAARVNIRNVSIVKRLAALYEKQGGHKKAMELLERAAQEVPTDRRLNFKLARLLTQEGGPPEVIEKHLRRSFTRNDTNYYAQLLYARQLYIHNKIDEAMVEFNRLSQAAVPWSVKSEVVEPWLDSNQSTLRFFGEVVVAEYTYAKIRRDKGADEIFVPQAVLDDPSTPPLRRQMRVEFDIGFNFLGPVARSVSAQS